MSAYRDTEATRLEAEVAQLSERNDRLVKLLEGVNNRNAALGKRAREAALQFGLERSLLVGEKTALIVQLENAREELAAPAPRRPGVWLLTFLAGALTGSGLVLFLA